MQPEEKAGPRAFEVAIAHSRHPGWILGGGLFRMLRDLMTSVDITVDYNAVVLHILVFITCSRIL